MKTTNLSKLRRERMLKTIIEIKRNITDEQVLSSLSMIENELVKKKYGLIWEEHLERVDKELKTQIPTFEEVKKYNIYKKAQANFNFLLEGDNLHSLYLLEKTHKEKVDVIYIDPPYNLGKKDFSYNDTYIDEDDGYKHSKWLSFMDRRLLIAYKLLRETGFIAISIDEVEFAQLKLLCDNIFGEGNFMSNHHIQVRYANKSLNEKNDWQPLMEYVLIYAKDKTKFKANLPYKEYDLDKFLYEFEIGNPDEVVILGNKKVEIFKEGNWKIKKSKKGDIGLLKETWASGSVLTGNTSGKFFEQQLSPRKEIDGLKTLYKVYGIGEDGIGYRYFTGPSRIKATRGKFYSGVPLIRRDELENDGESRKYNPIINYYDFSAEFGNIRHEGGVPFNNGKKPIALIQQLINYHKNKDILILDFFAGSGSTGQAVMQQNNEDGGSRSYILCTNNENLICEEITYKRLANIQKELPHNLKYYKTSFIPRVNNEKENVHKNLLINIKNLIQLENGIEIDDKLIRVFLTETELDDFTKNNKNLEEVQKIYISSDILLTSKQQKHFKNNNIEIFVIPEYYFKEEILEVL